MQIFTDEDLWKQDESKNGDAIIAICERADQCDKLTSDGERCRHGYPHPRDSWCEIGCCAKLPFGAVCHPLPNVKDQARR